MPDATQPTAPKDVELRSPDGRTIGVRVAGSEEGPLVIYLHGSPSSRLDVDFMHERSRRRGVRLVGNDRPGYGLSTPMPFTFATVARDVAFVADAFDAPTFAVIGQSSGAPYALATAAELPDRVTAVAEAGGGKPFPPGSDQFQRLSDGEQQGIVLAGSDDAEAERLLAEADLPFVEMAQLSDEEIEAQWMSMLAPADQRVMRAGFGKLIGPTMREALRQGQTGWARDNLVRMPHWDFELAAITAPATIWSGLQDTGNVEGARWVADQIPGAVLRELPDHGHFVAFELWDDILDRLGV